MISVCMATYNGERFIRQQIDSILSQLEENDELVVSDDGSSDRTLDIVRSFNDKRIKLVLHEQPRDLRNVKHSKGFYYSTSNFENAIKKAKGDFIFLSDQDDVWTPNKKEVMLNVLADNLCAMCNCSVIDSNGNIIKDRYWEKQPFYTSVVKNLCVSAPYLGCCIALRKEALDFLFPFPNKLMLYDLWCGTLCCQKNAMFFIDEPLHLYRHHESNVSACTTKSKNSLFYKISYRITFLFQFYKRVLFNR